MLAIHGYKDYEACKAALEEYQQIPFDSPKLPSPAMLSYDLTCIKAEGT